MQDLISSEIKKIPVEFQEWGVIDYQEAWDKQETLFAEIVNIKSFGATGDGATDETVAIQRAIDQLFINSSTKGTEQSRVRLYIPAGLYKVSATIYVPPYCTIYGDGADKTKFSMTGNAPVFQTVNSSSTPGNYANDSTSTTLNQARNINNQFILVTHNGDYPVSEEMSNFIQSIPNLKTVSYTHLTLPTNREV